MDYQSNSKKSKEERQDDNKAAKQLEKVVTTEVIQKPRSLSQKFKMVFLGGDFKDALRYVIADVILPSFRNMIVEGSFRGIERVVYGEAQRRMRPPEYRSYIQYNNPLARRTHPPDPRDPRDRAYLPDQRRRPERTGSRDLDNIIVGSKADADNVVESLINIVDQYQVASVGDLFALLGLSSSHVDEKWGWTYLNNIEIRQGRDGYLIDLPPVEEI